MRSDEFAAMMKFLWARLDEDENAARALKRGKNQDLAKLQARFLADVEAKRRLVDWVEEDPRRMEDHGLAVARYLQVAIGLLLDLAEVTKQSMNIVPPQIV